VPFHDPTSYTGGSNSSWQGYPCRSDQRVEGRQRPVPRPSRFGGWTQGQHPCSVKNNLVTETAKNNKTKILTRTANRSVKLADGETLAGAVSTTTVLLSAKTQLPYAPAKGAKRISSKYAKLRHTTPSYAKLRQMIGVVWRSFTRRIFAMPNYAKLRQDISLCLF
jgi:hypothetical protein